MTIEDLEQYCNKVITCESVIVGNPESITIGAIDTVSFKRLQNFLVLEPVEFSNQLFLIVRPAEPDIKELEYFSYMEEIDTPVILKVDPDNPPRLHEHGLSLYKFEEYEKNSGIVYDKREWTIEYDDLIICENIRFHSKTNENIKIDIRFGSYGFNISMEIGYWTLPISYDQAYKLLRQRV
jgi:hypothetical protein